MWKAYVVTGFTLTIITLKLYLQPKIKNFALKVLMLEAEFEA